MALRRDDDDDESSSSEVDRSAIVVLCEKVDGERTQADAAVRSISAIRSVVGFIIMRDDLLLQKGVVLIFD